MAYRNVSSRRKNLLTLQTQPKMVQAILKGDIHKVKQLISQEESVNETDVAKRGYLHLAASIGATEVAKILIAAGSRVDAKDKTSLTPFHRACRQNHDDVATILIDNKADVNARDINWVTPLHICAAHNSLECAKLFIAKVVNIDATDRGGATALHHAAFNGSCDILTFLLKQGSSPNAFDKEDRRPLHWAASLDNIDAIRLLIVNGAKVNARDKNLRTPLHYAAASGALYAIQSMLEQGADVSAVDREGNTALHMACVNGQDDVMDELLGASDAIINAPNLLGMTPLHFAAASTNGTACLEALVAYQGPAMTDLSISELEEEELGIEGALAAEERPATKLLIDSRDKYGRTPLHLAAKFGRIFRVQELLRVDADPNASDKTMMTPLHYAVRSGHTQVIEVLLAQKTVDPNVMDEAGMTPLHHAAFFGLSASVSVLLKSPKPANMLIHDITGRYPHFLAAMSRSLECLELLFPPDYRHFLSSLDNFDRSPLHYAAAAGNAHQCLQYLLGLRKRVGRHDQDEDDERASQDQDDDKENEDNLLLPLFAVNQSDIFGRTPLHYAAGADAEGRSIELLLFAGAKLDTLDSEGYYTLNYAAAAGKLGALQNLLNYSAFAWHRVRFKLCPAHSAAFNGHSECLELLMGAGIFEDLHTSMAYAKSRGHGTAYQAINYYISTNDSSVYFTADEDGNQSALDLSDLSLNSSFSSSLDLKLSSCSPKVAAVQAAATAVTLVVNGTKGPPCDQLTNGQHPHVKQLNA